MRDSSSGGVVIARGGERIEYRACGEISFRSAETRCGGSLSIS